MDDQKRRDDGMVQRRKVLGDAWVDKSITNTRRVRSSKCGRVQISPHA